METENIKLLLSALGSDEKDIESALDMAKKLSFFMSLSSDSAGGERKEQAYEEEIPPKGETRGFQIINAALPYIDAGYRKKVFVAVKCLELSQANRGGTLFIKSDDKNTFRKRVELLKAVDPYLSSKEKKKTEVLKKLIEIESLLGG